MGKADKITRRQLLAAALVAVFSPATRLIPGASVNLGGYASWLSPVFAAPPLFLLSLLLCAMLRTRQDGEGLAEIFERILGKVGGRILTAAYALWLLFYSGFVLRTAAERLISAVYSTGTAAFFCTVMIAVAAIAASCRCRTVVRAAQAIAPIVIAALAFVAVFGAADIKAENLLPVEPGDAGNVLAGALPYINIISGFVSFAFLAGHIDRQPGAARSLCKWIVLVLALLFIMSFVTIGALSATLVQKLQQPFFIMIRNINVFGTVERTEPIIIAVWVFADFIFLALLLKMITTLFGKVTARPIKASAAWAAAALTLAVSLLFTDGALEMKKFSEYIIPAINFFIVLIALPLVCVIGKLRKRI